MFKKVQIFKCMKKKMNNNDINADSILSFFHQQNLFSEMNVIYLFAQLFAFYALSALINEGNATEGQNLYRAIIIKQEAFINYQEFSIFPTDKLIPINPWIAGHTNYRMISKFSQMIKTTQNEISQKKIKKENGKNLWSFLNIIFRKVDKIISTFLQILPGVQASDIGQIAYFEGDCPDGWEEYTYARGRFIIGAGDYSGVAEYGRTETMMYNIRNTGGEIRHKLIVGEMPSHNHEAHPSWINGSGNGIIVSFGGTGVFNGATEMTGGEQAHNNIPPYKVLRTCKKLKEIELSHYLKLSDLNIYVKQSFLESLNLNGLQTSFQNLQNDLNISNQKYLMLQSKNDETSQDQNDLRDILVAAIDEQNKTVASENAEILRLSERVKAQAIVINDLTIKIHRIKVDKLNENIKTQVKYLNENIQAQKMELSSIFLIREYQQAEILHLNEIIQNQTKHIEALEQMQKNQTNYYLTVFQNQRTHKNHSVMVIVMLTLSIISSIGLAAIGISQIYEKLNQKRRPQSVVQKYVTATQPNLEEPIDDAAIAQRNNIN